MIAADELIVDLFCGAGGASEGIKRALGRGPDVAINHNEEAVAAHRANHPGTHHVRGNVWHANPREVCGSRPVGLLWLSPTCTFFSQAKGGALDHAEATKVRALASVAIPWASTVRPRLIVVENVPAFRKWGPLLANGQPDPKKVGRSFNNWAGKLRAQGYVVEWREMVACDYGAPTSRKRLFIIARNDGAPIVWPTPTHGPHRIPYRTAASCIDWTIPVPSIFGRRKPLVEATLRRIARGIRRFVIESSDPYVVGNRAAFLTQQSYGERKGQEPRVLDIRKPLGTIVAGGVTRWAARAVWPGHALTNHAMRTQIWSPTRRYQRRGKWAAPVEPLALKPERAAICDLRTRATEIVDIVLNVPGDRECAIGHVIQMLMLHGPGESA